MAARRSGTVASVLRTGPAGLPSPSTCRARPRRWDRNVATALNGARIGVASCSHALKAFPAQAFSEALAKHPDGGKGFSTRRSARGCSSMAAEPAISITKVFQMPAKGPCSSAQLLFSHAKQAVSNVAADLIKAQRRRMATAIHSR